MDQIFATLHCKGIACVLSEMQNLRPHLYFLNQNIHFNSSLGDSCAYQGARSPRIKQTSSLQRLEAEI